MNRFTTFSAALVLAAAAATSALAEPTLFNLGANFGKQQQIDPDVLRNIVVGPIQTVCPDIKLATSQHERADGSIRVTIKVINTSGADYVSETGRQVLVIEGSEGGRSGSLAFGNVRRGDEIIWGDIFRPFEFPASYRAHLAFDPDIRIDGNPQNDDCRSSNNTASITTLR